MKKLIIALAVVAIMAVAITPAAVFAQSGSGNGFGGNGAGMMGQTGTTGTGVLSGTLHDYMIAAYADALNLSVDVIDTRLAAGETLSEIAISTGLSIDEFQALAADARTSAIAAALADGVITQAQADWLTARIGGARGRDMMGMGAAGFARGNGSGTGLHQNPACPYLQAAQ